MGHLEILVLGASFIGLNASHKLLGKVLPTLFPDGARKDRESVIDATTYHLTLLSPSSKFWFNVAAPREVVGAHKLPHASSEEYDTEFKKKYPDHVYTLLKGSATGVDFGGKTVTARLATGEERLLSYTHLIIATGSTYSNPAYKYSGDETATLAAQEELRGLLADTEKKNIVITGGGPVAVETSGEIIDLFEQQGSAAANRTLTIVYSSANLLPTVRSDVGKTAESQLKSKSFVRLLPNTRVESAKPLNPDPSLHSGAATVTLSNGSTLNADIYIDAHGTSPNTSFLPSSVLDPSTHRVLTDKYMRLLLEPDSHVYAAGDCTQLSNGTLLVLDGMIASLIASISRDMLKDASNAKEAKLFRSAKEVEFKGVPMTMMCVPIGMNGGTGIMISFKLWTFFVKFFKGKSFLTEKTHGYVEGKGVMSG